jgi:hypothetical protein
LHTRQFFIIFASAQEALTMNEPDDPYERHIAALEKEGLEQVERRFARDRLMQVNSVEAIWTRDWVVKRNAELAAARDEKKLQIARDTRDAGVKAANAAEQSAKSASASRFAAIASAIAAFLSVMTMIGVAMNSKP